MDDAQREWRTTFLRARAEAADRAHEVLEVLLAAEDKQQAVAALAVMLRRDGPAARGIPDHWGANLSTQDRRQAEDDLVDSQSSTEGQVSFEQVVPKAASPARPGGANTVRP